MQLLRSRTKKNSILISTSDIAFLILIFLIVTANLEYNPEITAPKIANTTEFLMSNFEIMLIEVTAEGELFFEGSIVSSDELEEKIVVADSNLIFKIYADETVPFFIISNILKQLHENGKQKILLMIEKERT